MTDTQSKRCAVCERRIAVMKYKIVIHDFTDDRGDFQSHPIHGTCLDRLWAWTLKQKQQRKSP